MAAESAELAPRRLSAERVGELNAAVERPCYDPAEVSSGIVHLGVGAFMRAHLAVYCDDVLAQEDKGWGIAGYSLRRPIVCEQLEPQDCLYTLGVLGAGSASYRLIAAIRSIAVAPQDPAKLIDRIASPGTRIVTMTVTEKAYCIDAQRGGLNAGHPDIRHDLANPGAPISLVGYLVAGLQKRRADSAGALAIVSCDNLPDNGRFCRAAVRDFAALADESLLDWIDEHVAFPSTMVDRIVPATTPESIDAAAAATGLRDEAFVATEAFSQWVIEDNFPAGRPAWEQAGALLVDDVAPYEAAKLRLLNGAHSTIAYLGYLAGYEYVHEVMADADLATFLRYLMTSEISPVTPQPAGMQHDDYIEALLERFRNPALQHRTWQIAMDGSQKLPQRLLGTVRDRLKAGTSIDALSLSVAAWMRYALGFDESGSPIEVSDPLADRYAAIAAAGTDNPTRLVREFLSIEAVFGSDLGAQPEFSALLQAHLEQLLAKGALASVRLFNNGTAL